MTRREDLNAQLTEIETMDLAQLRHTWRCRLRTAPPRVSAGLLQLALAHAVQEKAPGGLPNAAFSGPETATGRALMQDHRDVNRATGWRKLTEGGGGGRKEKRWRWRTPPP